MPKGIASLSALRKNELVNVVVETPRGSRAKYKYDPRTGLFELHKALALGFAFPYPFGFVPDTLGEDGDPVDAMIITALDPPMGSLVPATVIGAIKIEQTDPRCEAVRNDRLLVVPDIEHDRRLVLSIEDLSGDELRDIETFFVDSGQRDGKVLKIIGRAGAADAMKVLTATLDGPRKPAR